MKIINLIKKIISRRYNYSREMRIIHFAEHGIQTKQICTKALKIIKTLHNSGFQAYIVGGAVRDILLNKKPKDFDIVTDARPNQIKKIFRNCRLIGKRFRLAHIYFGRNIIFEVATFRASHNKKNQHQAYKHNGIIIRDNAYGSIDEDVVRRDFSINALYYDPFSQIIIDFCQGFECLSAKKLCILGNPKIRYQEDPVRMLRAIRFSGKFNLHIEKSTANIIIKKANLIQQIPSSRLYEEVLKLFYSGAAEVILTKLEKYSLLNYLLPTISESFKQNPKAKHFIKLFLREIDKKIKQKKPLSVEFLFAALLWCPLIIKCKKTNKIKQLSHAKNFEQQSKLIIQEQYINIPHNVVMKIRNIWQLQHRLENRQSRYVQRILSHSCFRAALDLLILRSKIDKNLQKQVKWWQRVYEENINFEKNTKAVSKTDNH